MQLELHFECFIQLYTHRSSGYARYYISISFRTMALWRSAIQGGFVIFQFRADVFGSGLISYVAQTRRLV